MTLQISLPTEDGQRTYRVRGRAHRWPDALPPAKSRTAYAAAHVVADPSAQQGPGLPAALDWDATLAHRRRLWRLGLGVADAMDTAQRGMGLDWQAARELIRRSGAEARAAGGLLACGAGTDQLPPGSGPSSLPQIIDAYAEQMAVVEEAGAVVILMASRALAATARHTDDYLTVYDALLRQARRPVILHWLGPMFDPALAGYWGDDDLDRAAAAVLTLIRRHAGMVDGIKVSLLDAAREVALRRALPPGVRLYTGDDFHYSELIRGDAHGHSDALLGVFDAIAAPAAAALRALDAGDVDMCQAVLAPTVPLAREIFAPPTRHYKTGIVFLAWLAGWQDRFTMVGGLQAARDVRHLAKLFRLADQADLFADPELAVARMGSLLRSRRAG